MTVSDDIIVSAHGLVKRFGEFTAVNGIDLDIRRGEIFGFLGPNGAGKTTTMRMATTLTPPTAGWVEVCGHRLHGTSDPVKEKIGIRQDDLKAKKAELATIVESTSKEEAKLRAERDACAAKIDARTMSAYDRIRQSCNNHLAVVSVFNNDSCGGCFNTIAPQRLIDIASNKKMIICEYCGRILVNPDFE